MPFSLVRLFQALLKALPLGKKILNKAAQFDQDLVGTL